MNACTSPAGAAAVVEPSAFEQQIAAADDAVILDVRRPDEFAQGHIRGAVNIDWLNPELFAREASRLSPDATYYVYCRSGRRSAEAAAALGKLGLKTVDLRGGILAWEAQGLPLEK